MKTKCAVITESDFDRLHGLVTSRPGRASYGLPTMALEQDLTRVQVIAAARVPRGVVTMNSRVRIRDVRSLSAETYVLAYPADADITVGRLSVLSPLGRALLGARTGETVTVDTPGGKRRVRIERIVYQPEAAGDFHL